MNIKEMINAVFPTTLKQEDIIEVMTNVRQSLRDNAMEVVALAIQDSPKTDLSKDKEYISMLNGAHRNFKTNKPNLDLFNLFGVILKHSDDILTELIDLATKKFTKVVDKDSMDYPRTQILGLVNTISLVSDYIPQYIHWLCVQHNETKGNGKVTDFLTKNKIEYVKKNYVDFMSALQALQRVNSKTVKQMINNIPTVDITETGDEQKLFQKASLDPSGVVNGFLSASTNPFYYFRMWMVDRAHTRYKRNQEEIESIKVELEAMNSQLTNGQVDARTERQRELAMQRMQKLEYEVAKHEEKVHNTRY